MKPAAGGAILATLAVLGAGCSGASTASRPPAATASAAQGPPPARPVGVVTHVLPGCTTGVQRAPELTGVTSNVAVPLNPFGVVATRNGGLVFVSLTGTNTIGVYRTGAASAPVLVRQIKAIAPVVGEALTPDERYLLAADDGAGAEVISVAAAEQGAGHAVLGDMTDTAGTGAVDVEVTPNGKYAFVSLEDAGAIAVFSLQRALAGGLGTAGYVGSIPVVPTPTNVAFSPDGQWAYASNEGATLNVPGTLDVISVRKAETDPAASIVASVPAGCNPVRVITAATGDVVWVSDRASDAVLAFSAAGLRAAPARSLLAVVRVGEAPVGMALVRNGTRLVVADSNRFNVPGASASLAVVDVPDALAGRPALLGYAPAGVFPRNMAIAAGGQSLLVTNFGSNQLETVDVAGLP
jgi:DNA-binding beta-propeller fold protein YncE